MAENRVVSFFLSCFYSFPKINNNEIDSKVKRRGGGGANHCGRELGQAK